MRSIKFPDIFNNTSVNIVSDYDATLQNLMLLLYSEKTELFGDPYFGTGLKASLFDQNDIILEDLIIDKIFTAIVNFMPQIRVEREDIKIVHEVNPELGFYTKPELGEVRISIKATNMADFETNLYNIVLTNTIV